MGAPDSACARMQPGHGYEPQAESSSPNPYTLAVDLSSIVFYSASHVGDSIPVESGKEVTLVRQNLKILLKTRTFFFVIALVFCTYLDTYNCQFFCKNITSCIFCRF